MISDHELRQILLEDADDAPAVPVQDLLAGIRHKVKVRRRARLAGAAVAIAVVVAASLAIVPRFVDTSSPEPIEPIPDRPHLEFPQRIDGLPVFASRVNAPGATSIEWRPILRSVNDATLVVFCRIPQPYAETIDLGSGSVALVVTINNDIVATSECQAPKVEPSYPPHRQEITKRGYLPLSSGVEPGEPFAVSMWLQQGQEPIDLAGAEFGLGFWEPGHRVKPFEADPQFPRNARGA